MLKASCHCGKVKWTLKTRPEFLVLCNCSICRRLGTRWTHNKAAMIDFDYKPDEVNRYIWGDKEIAFVSCKTCGCTTHWESLKADYDRHGLNCNMVDPKDLVGLRERRFDGAETFQFIDP